MEENGLNRIMLDDQNSEAVSSFSGYSHCSVWTWDLGKVSQKKWRLIFGSMMRTVSQSYSLHQSKRPCGSQLLELTVGKSNKENSAAKTEQLQCFSNFQEKWTSKFSFCELLLNFWYFLLCEKLQTNFKGKTWTYYFLKIHFFKNMWEICINII